MSIFKRPLCWVTRHHWLLQDEQPTDETDVFIYWYECQVCGKWNSQRVTHLN